jgi:hypothetical protein
VNTSGASKDSSKQTASVGVAAALGVQPGVKAKLASNWEIDFTRRLINSRVQYFAGFDFDHFCEGEIVDIYRQLFYASTGNPRIIGHILHNLRESHIAYGQNWGACDSRCCWEIL